LLPKHVFQFVDGVNLLVCKALLDRLPKMLSGLEFRGIGRKLYQANSFWHTKVFGQGIRMSMVQRVIQKSGLPAWSGETSRKYR
jgi:hypothetical protein